MSKVTVVIPARYESTRFPGKPLAPLLGKPMIQWVWEAAKASKRAARVVVATDDPRIRRAVADFGGESVMTDPEHPTGTDRIAEVAAGDDSDIYVNVQGDEPLLRGDVVDAVIEPLLGDSTLEMASAYRRFQPDEDPSRPDTVKVVCGRRQEALYFSRSLVPHYREAGHAEYLAHIGLYAYRRRFLLAYAKMEPTPLEQAERLEQLRALEHGHRIYMVEVAYRGIGVDRPEDLPRAEARLRLLAP